jgi:type II secretory pathway pseudopilin PulG
MKRPFRCIAHSAAFGSAWMLVGLAFVVIMGTLAWPKIQQASEKAKIDSVSSVVRNYRLACLSYYTRRGTYPLDGEEGVSNEGGGFVRLNDGRVLDPLHTTLGDILIHQGYLTDLAFPIDTKGEQISIRALSADVLIKKVGNGSLFESAPTLSKAVVLVVPNISAKQAHQLEEIFQRKQSRDSTTDKSVPRPVGDCRLSFYSGEEKADAYIYLAHE